MKASVLFEPGQPLEVEDLDIEAPRDDEVVVRMVAAVEVVAEVVDELLVQVLWRLLDRIEQERAAATVVAPPGAGQQFEPEQRLAGAGLSCHEYEGRGVLGIANATAEDRVKAVDTSGEDVEHAKGAITLRVRLLWATVPAGIIVR